MKQKAALVLSMGGARGMAHIGVIEELLRHNIEITSIAGSSMGALVGAMYATGKLEDCKEWFCSWNKKKLVQLADLSPNPEGLIKGNRFIREMRAILPDIQIENLPIPYVAMATDLASEREVRLDKGGLFASIRASISIPMVFHPLKAGKCVLVDGGILNPLPIHHVSRTPGDIVIAVDVNAPASNRKSGRFSPYQLLTTSSRLMMQELTRNEIRNYPPDLLIQLPANQFDMMEFYHASTIIEGGAEAARKALKDFQFPPASDSGTDEPAASASVNQLQ